MGELADKERNDRREGSETCPKSEEPAIEHADDEIESQVLLDVGFDGCHIKNFIT